VPLSDLTLGKIIQRFLLYVGIALAVLAVFAAVIVFTKGGVGDVSGGWFGLVGYTGLLFWVTIRQTREHWQRLGYWLAIGGLLVVHSLAFVAILRAYPQWRMIWFLPVVIVEGGLFGAILYLLFADRKRQ
jgi:hypothetical protein